MVSPRRLKCFISNHHFALALEEYTQYDVVGYWTEHATGRQKHLHVLRAPGLIGTRMITARQLSRLLNPDETE